MCACDSFCAYIDLVPKAHHFFLPCHRILVCTSICMLHCIQYGHHSRYDLMVKCWNKSPAKRPHFSELVSEISTSLEVMAGYMKLSTEPLTADLTVTTGEECVEEESSVSLGLETEETVKE